MNVARLLVVLISTLFLPANVLLAEKNEIVDFSDKMTPVCELAGL